jgi:hypothetical protein
VLKNGNNGFTELFRAQLDGCRSQPLIADAAAQLVLDPLSEATGVPATSRWGLAILTVAVLGSSGAMQLVRRRAARRGSSHRPP